MKTSHRPPLYVIQTLADLEQYLKRPCVEAHLFCYFQKEAMHHHHLVTLKEKKVKSVSFANAHTIYPYHPFTHLNDARSRDPHRKGLCMKNSLSEFAAMCRNYGMSISFDNNDLSLKEKEQILSQIVETLDMEPESAESFIVNVLSRCS
ncbi:hypothetical protein MD535_22385 [Vibrio sp. ZSDZ65]|uniref:Uncharacterized protein n=1 Tax=Vibrio qingdaonensis TaxID=2829491 RepID=A0A9X3HYP0_9VIBR|nr:hypothetical protein [Vibrio qingdaonensis]MCW8348741.1 hypothetical protein [Vibrio qingdaonensis]